MDQQAILSGMGIALITTLMGLVISVILNFFTTEVSGFFNRSLTQFPRVAEKLRAWVFITQPIQPVVSMDKPVPEIIQPEEQILAVETESTEQDEIKYELIEISGNNQKSLVKQQIKSPLVVECNQIQDGKKKKAVGEEILFTVVSGQGSFENGHTEIVTKTNTAGRAKVYFTPEEPNGSNQIEVRHAKLTGKPILFKVEVIALKPADIRIKDGNNQSGPSGKKLVNPLVVEVVDDDLNPVYGCFVNMQVEMGDGFFNNNETTIQVSTDDKGLAAAEFILGKDGGFNSVKAEITELPGKYLSFQALGQ